MKLSAVHFCLFGSVIFYVKRYPWALTKHLYSLDCSSQHYQHRLLIKLYGNQRWDSGFPVVLVLRIVCSSVTQTSMVQSSGLSTSHTDRVSLLSFWKNLLKHKDLCWFLCVLSIPICSHFTGSVLTNVKITPERSVRVLVGDTLILNCTGETTYNGRINFTWDFPRRKVS